MGKTLNSVFFLLFLTIGILSCEKTSSSNDDDITESTNSADSIKIAKSAMNQIWNPEEFFGIWKLNHIQYGQYDFTGDSTYWPQFQYWRVSGKNVIFYDTYYKNIYNTDMLINNHYTLLNYSIGNGKLECDVLDGGGPAYKYARKMHCTYSKVKDY